MSLHIAFVPKLIAQKRASAILGMTIIAMLWTGLAVKYGGDVRQDFLDTQRSNQNYALLFEENVLRSIGEIDKALLYLRGTVEATKETTDYQTIVNTTDVLSEIIVQVAIIDSNGISRGSNAIPAPTEVIDISDRDHFRVHVNSKEDHLFISKPVIGRASKKWSVQFTRRFSNKDGSFAGIVVASMNPAHFTNFYDKIDLGSATSVAMIGNDGVVRSSGGRAVAQHSLGQDLHGSHLFAQLQPGSDVSFTDAGASPRDSLFVTARKVRGYPLWVIVSTTTDEIYQGSWASLRQNGLIVGVLTVMILIAIEHILRAEAKAEQKAQQLQLTLAHISQGIMLVTNDRKIPIINNRCSELLKLPDELIRAPADFERLTEYQERNGEFLAVTDGHWLPVKNNSDQTLAGPSMLDYRRSDGAVIEVCKTTLPDGGFVQTFTDITTRREAEAHIARLASEDPLTKLPNRRILQLKLEKATIAGARQGRRSGSKNQFAILFLDMDRFKVVNDTLGHRVGDMLLVKVAQRLKAVLRENDVLARLGGDEFAVLLPDIESRVQIESLAKRIIETMANPFQVDNHLITSSVSIGIAVGPVDGNTADELLVAADLALYAVKSDHRGAFRFYEQSLNDDVNDRRQIELDLRDALDRGELELQYQPIIDVRRNTVAGFEALARWHHAAKGMISPDKFIPVAEDCGLILPLGEWALAEACRAAAKWPGDLKIAVNLSPVQLSSPNLPTTIACILASTGIAPNRLSLEITERVFLDYGERTLSILHQLKNLGIQISLDDFGTGYSSLSYLRTFPFDTIKIDRSFVSDLGEDAGSRVIVQAVLLIASGLGIRTVAEGVETSVQREFLTAMGCDELQGYLLSAPVPVAKIPALIDEFSSTKTRAA